MASLDWLGYVHCASTEVVEWWTDRYERVAVLFRPGTTRATALTQSHGSFHLGWEDGRAAGRSSGPALFGTTK
jgi:hypothetical protein